METNLWTKRKISCARIVALVSTCGLMAVAQSEHGTQVYATIGAPALSNSNLALGGGELYEVRFDPQEFTGDLVARSIGMDGTYTQDEFDADGNLVTFNGDWRAQVTVDKQSNRQGSGSDTRAIITAGSNGVRLVGRRFVWDHSNNGLTFNDGANEDLKALVNPDSTEANKQDGAFNDPIVSWVRGSDEFEGGSGSELRERKHALSNIVHSSPQYVGPPFQPYTFDNYASFRSDLSSRAAMIYVGSNMLHGFDASDGTEVFAYIPHGILGKLKAFTSQNYVETFLVDGTPTVADVYDNFVACPNVPCWQTILLGSLGLGGNSIFALNVTDPVSVVSGAIEPEAEAAANLFLWEFTDPDLGLTTSRPIVVRLSDGTWAAIFGNGRDAGKAVLFVVDISTGALIQKLEVTSSGAENGLSSPIAWDNDFDDDIDTVYAGDLEGNLWRFDFSNANESGGGRISFSDSPLVSVTDPDSGSALPITTAPVISLHPERGLLIYFGTSINGQHINGLFGIEDVGVAHGVDPPLVMRSMSPVVYESNDPKAPSRPYRISASSTSAGNPVGWRLNLPVGERILNEPILTNKRVSFTSTNPVIEDFNENWFVAVDFMTGGAPELPFLDVNDDGLFDDNDLFVDIDDDGDERDTAVPIGRFLDVGVVSSPVPANVSSDQDTVFIAHGLESSGIASTGLGLPGGHFDQDVFTRGTVDNHEHTHRYDDKYNIDGVNMLNSGGTVTNPPNVESANGILSHNQALKDQRHELDHQIFIRIINPYSVDTPKLAAQRAARGLDGNVAPHATIFYQCGQAGERFVLNAPSFNSLPKSNRSCVLSNIQELRIKFASLNSLRATTPGCIRANETGPVLGDPAVGLNGPYRDGAITIQAIRASDDAVFWEHVSYEHLDDANIQRDLIANDRQGGDRIHCGAVNEDLRAHLDLHRFEGSDGGPDTGSGRDGDGVVTVSTRGVRLTEHIDVSRAKLVDGRVSWREVLK